MSTITKVYRVEDPARLDGPYSNGYGSATLRMRADHNNGPAQLHPSPYVSMQVSMSRQTFDTKCAFNSMQALFSWFGGWLPGLLKEGFRVAVVEDAYVTHGPDHVGQVLFRDNRKARR
jgi:hypothetical protein